MDDVDLVEHVRQMKPEALRRLAALPGRNLSVTDPVIIEAAWGPRRVSGRSRGMALRAYPTQVGAARELWERWLAEDHADVSIVIAKKRAQARIDAALGYASKEPDVAEPEPLAGLTQDEIDDMLAERAELRAARKFAEADRIRDYLVHHGVEVQDRQAAHG